MAPIRVLQVVGRMDRGGIETLIMNLYRKMDRSKVQFDFLCHYGQEADYNGEIRSLGGRIYEMPVIKTIEKTYYHKLGSYIYSLHQFFKEHKEYQVIHGHMTNTAAIYMPIAKSHGVKHCIAHSHLTKARKGLSGVVTDVLQLPISRVATDYFSCSNKASEWLFSKKIVNTNQVKLLKNGIDTEDYKYDKAVREEIRELLGIKDKIVMGHVGRFYYEKNHDFLIDIYYEFQKEVRNSCLVLAGDGVMRERIEKKVKDLGIAGNVMFLGVRDDIPLIMQGIDVFVMPSHFEGLPVVGIEAQAAGLPCVISEVITKEIDVTSNVEFLSLDKGAKNWALVIKKILENFQRIDTTDLIKKNGYEIDMTAQWLQEFYLMKSIN